MRERELKSRVGFLHDRVQEALAVVDEMKWRALRVRRAEEMYADEEMEVLSGAAWTDVSRT